MDQNEVINRIAFFRQKNNLSARELSLRLGKHESYINKLENRDFNLPTAMLLQIIDVLGTSVVEFFSDNYMDYQRHSQLTNLINQLPADKKDSLIALISK